jgi:hypothetical protein
MMTALSEQFKGCICIYCANNKGGCLADVPYYAVSIYCKFFREEPLVRIKRPFKPFNLKKILVETI